MEIMNLNTEKVDKSPFDDYELEDLDPEVVKMLTASGIL